ncbi:hypothetical protein A8B76_05145 [Roseovarius indicus]|nr:hypothetical protein A8B76_05145 [Roseovarius indicus]
MLVTADERSAIRPELIDELWIEKWFAFYSSGERADATWQGNWRWSFQNILIQFQIIKEQHVFLI